MSSTRIIIDYARGHGGIVTTQEALRLGMSRSTLMRRVKDGVFSRIRDGVYSLPGLATRYQIDLEAACRVLGGVVSHESAARLHGFDNIPLDRPVVTVPHRRTHDFPDVIIHQSTDLTETQVAVIGGLPVTTPERTILDLASVLPDGRLDSLIDQTLASRAVDLAVLHDLFDQLARRGKPGIARMRRLLEKRTDGYVAAESELEFRLLDLIERAGLPVPVRQFRAPWLGETNGRVDLAYPDSRLVIEGDSRRWHTLMNSFDADRRRDNAAQLAGWRVLRFTWLEITKEPSRVVTVIRTALAA